MRRIVKNFNLKKYNTFGIEVFSDYFFAFTDIVELKSFLKNDLYNHLDKRILGAGSNVLLTNDFHGVVIHPFGKNIQLKKKREDYFLVKVDAGLNWDTFVEQSIQNSWYGLENLSGIPGDVGATPIQNIGAYGVEVKDFIDKVEAVNLETHEIVHFRKEQCNFGYRDSIFKNEFKNKFVITAVYFRLLREPILQTKYKLVENELNKFDEPSVSNLRKAILKIRDSKLPKTSDFPNAGSFFKNPVIPEQLFKKINLKFKEVPSYPEPNNQVKVPAAWLIEKCGFKGYQNGNVSVHKKQALVLINKGNASGSEILALSDKIIAKVSDTFGVQLEREVNLFP